MTYGETTGLELVDHSADKDGFFYDINPAYSYARLRIAPDATYEDIKEELIYNGEADEHGVCHSDDFAVTVSARCFLQVYLPQLENRIPDFTVVRDIPQGIYYLGVQDISYYKGDGYILFADKSDIQFSITDSEDPSSFIIANKHLKINFSDADNETIQEVYEEELQELSYQGEKIFRLFSTKKEGASGFGADEIDSELTEKEMTPFVNLSKKYSWDPFESYCRISSSDDVNVCRLIGAGGKLYRI